MLVKPAPTFLIAALLSYHALAVGLGTLIPYESRLHAVLDPVASGDVDVEVDYLEAVDARTLAPVDPLAGEVRLLGAVRFGRARLLDNVGVTVPAPTA